MNLVVYYTLTGKTEQIVNKLREKIKCDVEKLIDKKKRRGILGFLISGRDALFEYETEIEKPLKDPSKYKIVILATPVWAGNITPAIRTYINLYKKRFKKIALIITSFSKSDSDPNKKIIKRIIKITGLTPVCAAGFSFSDFKPRNIEKLNEKLDYFVKVIKSKI